MFPLPSQRTHSVHRPSHSSPCLHAGPSLRAAQPPYNRRTTAAPGTKHSTKQHVPHRSQPTPLTYVPALRAAAGLPPQPAALSAQHGTAALCGQRAHPHYLRTPTCARGARMMHSLGRGTSAGAVGEGREAFFCRLPPVFTFNLKSG